MPSDGHGSPIRLIAFYLPQFHPIPENDEWWGKGFTEWTNVARGTPQFVGHYQPHRPADFGYYDLRVPEVREQQADLARQYGVSGFCYYYYWFNGQRLLDRPLTEVLSSGRPDFPFCICWANENWTRRWDGSEHQVLIAQRYSPGWDERFLCDVAPILRDRRYMRIADSPLLLVYRPGLLPDAARTTARWRQVAKAEGIPSLHLCAVQSFGFTDPRKSGFDSAVEFPPHGNSQPNLVDKMVVASNGFSGCVFSYRRIATQFLDRKTPKYRRFRCVMVGWDNSPRTRTAARIFHPSSPQVYEEWLSGVIDHTRRTHPPDECIVFVNAWNEWAEGAHLEPDEKFGHAFLRATRRALTSPTRLGASADGSKADDSVPQGEVSTPREGSHVLHTQAPHPSLATGARAQGPESGSLDSEAELLRVEVDSLRLEVESLKWELLAIRESQTWRLKEALTRLPGVKQLGAALLRHLSFSTPKNG